MPDLIYPVLLAGGSGSRLWPLSRKSYPKQFSKLINDNTLFQNSAIRLTSSVIVEFAPHITLTHTDFRFIVSEQLQEMGLNPGPILVEPTAKNTAAAILAACLFAHSKDENAILIVSPSDHVIPNLNDFHEAVKVGLSYSQNGKIVAFGIKPKHSETGYGYLKLSKVVLDHAGTADVEKFVEKPNLEQASKMLASGNFLWNAGIFLFRAKDMIDAFSVNAREIFDPVLQSVNEASSNLGFFHLAEEPWSKTASISIDYAIMEKVQNIVAVPYSSEWSDVGGWDAVWSEGKPDKFGNVVSETSHIIDCSNCLVRSDGNNQPVVGIGLNDIIAIAMPDAVLVSHKDRAQDVKKAVELLKSKDVSQAEVFQKDYCSWGWQECLAFGDCFQIKRLYLKPGATLSLPSHKFMSVHWVAVEGTAKTTINDEMLFIKPGQSAVVPQGAVNRLENVGLTPINLIEIQTGTYLGEDDIV